MSTTAPRTMTLEAFLEWERRQELRYEFNGVNAIAMTGGTFAHSEIATNIVDALRRRLRGGRCRAIRGDLKVIAKGHVRYPDAAVTCSPIANDSDIVPDPVVVFEVLSRSTASVDRIIKNAEYEATPTIRHYVMLEQNAVAATVFSRESADWRGRVVGADAVLAFPELGIDVPLREFYAGLDIPDEVPEEEP